MSRRVTMGAGAGSTRHWQKNSKRIESVWRRDEATGPAFACQAAWATMGGLRANRVTVRGNPVRQPDACCRGAPGGGGPMGA